MPLILEIALRILAILAIGLILGYITIAIRRMFND